MGRKSILLVEDNSDDIDDTLRAFARNQIANDVAVATDGEDALHYLFSTGPHAQRPPGMPAIVLLDLKLRGMTGVDVLRKIRGDERTRRLPVVVLTSSNEERDAIAQDDLGAKTFVRKPVDFPQFIEAARQLGIYWLVLDDARQRT
jgi:two-component system response regulator